MESHEDFQQYIQTLHDSVSAPKPKSSSVEESQSVLDMIQKINTNVMAEMDEIAKERDLTSEEADSVLDLSKTLRRLLADELIWRQGLRDFERRTRAVAVQ
jgi:hypothetical protein